MTKPAVIEAVKAFDAKLKCRDFQFEIGKSYTHEGPVDACKSGFHACENPLDVFQYYAPAASRFGIVELSGGLSRHDEDSKIAAGKIHIKAEIGIPEIVSRSIAWIVAHCNPVKTKHSTGNCSASSATGIAAVALNVGYEGQARASKDGAICLCAHNNDGTLRHIRASKVGENGIKPDTYYTLDQDGNFQEASS